MLMKLTPDSSLGFPFDYAILKLANTIDLTNPKVGVVCLPPDEKQTFVGANLTATGWGFTASGVNNPGWGSSSSPVLRGTFLTGISNDECANIFGQIIGPYHICASGIVNKSSICKGDSGGSACNLQFKIGN
jgi:hypothetical protein